MNIKEQAKAEKFYIESDINGIHTPHINMVEINYLDMLKLMHRYAQQQVKNNDCIADVVQRFPSNPEIYKWIREQKYQTEQGEQEYTLMYEIDMPKIFKAFHEAFF